MTRSRRRKLKRAPLKRHAGTLLKGTPFASVLLAGLPAAHAQTSDSGGLEEVVVSAQKRDENLQSVPLSIQALGTTKLEELHVENFTDYAKFLPSVSYQSLGPGFARVFMRGVSSGDNGNHSGPLPTVGTYLDEQPITTITGALDLHIYDIARVEALAGPQGTLYGASSQAGTIRIITNKPDPTGFKAGYDLQGSAVSGDQGYVAEGFVNIPLSPKSAVRLVGWAEHSPGFIDNVAATRCYPSSGICDDNSRRARNNYNDVDTYGARAALRIDLDDNWTITPQVMAQRQKSNGIFAFDPRVGDLKVAHFYPETSDDKWGQAALTVQGKLWNLDVTYAGAFLKRHDATQSDYSDYSYFYDVLSGGSFGAYFTDDNGNLINPSQFIQGKDRYQKYSNELRFSTPVDQAVRAVFGFFQQRQQHGIEQRYMINDLATASAVTGWPDTFWLTEQVRVDRDYAVFGELTFDITPKLTGLIGARFFWAKNSLAGFYGFGLTNPYGSPTGEQSCGVLPDTGPAPFHGAPCTNLNKTVNENGHTPKLNLTYHFTDDVLGYATFSKGFRPGGVNRRGTFPPYKSDFLKNYEIGWKTSWINNRLRFNGALFWEDWDNFQFSYLGENGLTNVTNAGGARIKGIEADLNWAVNANLQLGVSLTRLDPQLTQDFCKDLDPATNLPLPLDQCAPESAAAKGTQLPVTPKFKGNVVARYTVPMANDSELQLQGAFVYQGASTSALVPVEAQQLGPQPSYGIADFSATYNRMSYSLELFLNNAFDKHAAQYRYAECDSFICLQPYQGTNMPRLVGVRFAQKF
ncbi:MAG TPA: TonB-dependent receptor [Steroidobacteraceae bacterium]|nr:TonB-dependent receptor [Steroidobacteraceae bacterium]